MGNVRRPAMHMAAAMASSLMASLVKMVAKLVMAAALIVLLTLMNVSPYHAHGCHGHPGKGASSVHSDWSWNLQNCCQNHFDGNSDDYVL